PHSGFFLNGVKALETWWQSVLCGPSTVPWPSTSDTGLEVRSLAGATGTEAGDEPRPDLGLHVALVCVCVYVSLSEMLSQRIQFTQVPFGNAVLVSGRRDFESPCPPSVSCPCTQVSWTLGTLCCAPENLVPDEVKEQENQALLPDL
ncbi:hypothetical protein Celaphus_00009592, partial [Cervus elaphus hippelaphus]